MYQWLRFLTTLLFTTKGHSPGRNKLRNILCVNGFERTKSFALGTQSVAKHFMGIAGGFLQHLIRDGGGGSPQRHEQCARNERKA